MRRQQSAQLAELGIDRRIRLGFYCTVTLQNVATKIGDMGATSMVAAGSGSHQRLPEAAIHDIDQIPCALVRHA